MMLARLAWPLLAAASLTLAACGDDGGDDVAGPGAYDPAFETSAEFFTLMSGPVAGQSPHGTVQIWYSTNAMESLGGAVPVGTVSIKTADPDNDGTVDAHVVMIKREAGYDPDHGDWEYQMRAPGGAILDDENGQPIQGALELCISCHSAAAATDYLAGTSLR